MFFYVFYWTFTDETEIKKSRISVLNYDSPISVFIQRNAHYESEKIYIPLLIDRLISNNVSSMTFFSATRILRVIGRQIIRLYDSIR